MFVIIPFGLVFLIVLYWQRATLPVRKRRKQTAIIAATLTAVYNLMVCGLVYFEQMSAQPPIRGYFEAYFYSIRVILTAGYGDLFPVTVYGRLIGPGFVLLGILFYAFVIASAIRFVNRFRLKETA